MCSDKKKQSAQPVSGREGEGGLGLISNLRVGWKRRRRLIRVFPEKSQQKDEGAKM